ncbi:STAS domain-containing protein [Saccharothrix sp. Mg75]|uniref:STAS domain-containing protein n=1 Tax=Saccharothrix sp. Mg75 TaxID=3445357 RepID=UPI003EED59A8
MGSAPVTVQWDTAGGVPVPRVVGEIDPESVETLGYELLTWLEEATSDLVMDLTGMRFLVSAGLALLIQAAAHAQRCGVAFVVVVAGRRAVLRHLYETRLDKVLTICPDLDRAMSAVRGIAAASSGTSPLDVTAVAE